MSMVGTVARAYQHIIQWLTLALDTIHSCGLQGQRTQVHADRKTCPRVSMATSLKICRPKIYIAIPKIIFSEMSKELSSLFFRLNVFCILEARAQDFNVVGLPKKGDGLNGFGSEAFFDNLLDLQ
jgi:hypothetical protein